MKKVKLPIPNSFSLSWDMQSVLQKLSTDPEGKVFLGTMDFGEGGSELEIARENGAQIVYATTGIEKGIDKILALYFFGPCVGLNEKRNFFVNQVLQSSDISFAFKKNLVQKIIDKYELLKGKEKNSFQKNLKMIMLWRNAFAHGELVYDSRQGPFLRYFSGDPQTQKLDDDYWSKVESCFDDVNALLKKVIDHQNHSFIQDL